VPDNQAFPSGVPALLLGGDLDYLDINSERGLSPLFRNGTFVTVANAGHVTTWWNPCAQAIALRFLRTLHTGDTECAGDTRGAMGNPFGTATGKLQLQGVARFPERAGQAIPAQNDRTRDLHTSRFDRRIATVTWLTAVDAVYRLPRMTGTTGRGLRGGSYTVTRAADTTRIDYQQSRFTEDVFVSGHLTITRGNTLAGLVRVTGPGGRTGALTIKAVLWDPAHPRATLQGTLNGREIAVLTPTR
jgi:hypothetical protein